jgi:soluble lytic murein transglycosylase-like protein
MAASKKYRISGRLIEAVAWQESRFNPHAVSPKGAKGVMQLMPATARELGVDPGEPSQNIEGGAAYLSLLMRRFDGDLLQALSAYNAGPGAIARYGGEPPYAETQKFVDAVFDRLATMSADTEAPLEAEP